MKFMSQPLQLSAPSNDLNEFFVKNDWSKYYRKLHSPIKDQGFQGKIVWWPFPLMFSDQLLKPGLPSKVALKDGFANLLPFLLSKQALKCKQVIISEELYQMLPNQWRSHFLFYRYLDKRDEEPKSSLKTFISLDFYEGLDTCESILRTLRKIQSRDEALVLINHFSHYNTSDVSELSTVLNALRKSLPKASFVNWNDLERFSSMSGYDCHVLKNSLLTSHSYAEFLILQKSGRLAKKNWPWEDKETLITSHAYTPFVDIQILCAESDHRHPLEKSSVLKKLEEFLRQGERRKVLNFLLTVLEEYFS